MSLFRFSTGWAAEQAADHRHLRAEKIGSTVVLLLLIAVAVLLWISMPATPDDSVVGAVKEVVTNLK